VRWASSTTSTPPSGSRTSHRASPTTCATGSRPPSSSSPEEISMKGDFTRFSFDPSKHYSSVRMQQGRVQLDADWNEQVDIQRRLQRLQAEDLFGQSGAPLVDGGFKVTVSTDSQSLQISGGRMYVDGLLCELGASTTYDKQPDYPGAPYPTTGNGKDTTT